MFIFFFFLCPQERCLHKNETCPNGYYYEWVGPLEQGGAALRALAGKAVCRKCHPWCLRCSGFGFHDQVCQRCAGYKRGNQCVDDCPIEYYATTRELSGEVERECMPCDILCRGCYGPHASQCHACRHFKIFEVILTPARVRPQSFVRKFIRFIGCFFFLFNFPAQREHSG